MTALLDAFRKTNPDAVPFALTLVAKRLKEPWQIMRLATKAARSKKVADVAATPYAIAVPMVLDRLEDKPRHCGSRLKQQSRADRQGAS